MTRYMRKKDGDPFVYLWTPTLEARGDFEFVDDPSVEVPVSEEARDEILASLVETLETPPPPPEDDSPNPLTE